MPRPDEPMTHEQRVAEADAAGALLNTWSPDDFRRFAQFICGYAPDVVQEWHQDHVERKEP